VTPAATAKPLATPKPAKTPSPAATAVKTPTPTATPRSTPQPTPEKPAAQQPSAEDELRQTARYREVERIALKDKNVLEWKDKIHSATTDEEQRMAAQQYYKTLFNKMRQLDPSLRSRIDRIEATTLGETFRK
jgi:uncharacterized protein YkwD